jgi:hypothetical protein
MRAFTNYFINAVPWQLCLMMVAPYVVYKFSPFGHNPIEWGLLVLDFLLVILGWMYSIGTIANSRLSSSLRMPGWIFSVTTLFPFLGLFYFVSSVLIPLYQGELKSPPSWLIYLHFSVIFCIGFNIWYAAKQFITFKLNRATSFVDYYLVFMSLWFGFIGVWYLQPKIIRVFQRRDDP